MTKIAVKTGEVSAIADADIHFASLLIYGKDSYNELRKALNRALNTDDKAPQWLLDLCDSMELVQIPKPHSSR